MVCLRNIFSFALFRRLLIGVVMAYVATSLTLGGTRAAKPVFQAVVIAWILGVGIYHIWHWAPTPSPPDRWTRAVRITELVMWNLTLTLVLAELSLRVFASVSGTSLLMSDTLDAYRLRPGQDYGGGLRGNRLGYPGREFQRSKRAGVLRIAALGDSFAVGPAVAFADNYLTLLEAKLPGTEVYNFGVSSAGPREYQAVLRQDVWPFQPDLVLLSVFVGNDITEALPTPRFLDPRQHALYLLLTRGWRLMQESRRQTPTVWAGAAARLPPRGLSRIAFREVEARRLTVCEAPPSPSLEKKWQRALAHLDRIVEDCRGRQVPLAVVLIPDEFQVNPAVLEEALAEAGVQRSALDLGLPQRRLQAYFTRRGVPCLDLQPAFAGCPGTYAPCDTHWNERGNRLAAAAIGRWLTAIGLAKEERD
jgi:hypothetical protein